MRVFLCPGMCLYQAVAQATCIACLHAMRPAWSPTIAQSSSTVFCSSAPFKRTQSPWKGPKRLLFCRYPDVKLPVNGAVKFHWTELHGVWRIPSGTCPATFTPGNNLVELAPTSPSGSFTTPPLAAGTYWYSCPVRARRCHTNWQTPRAHSAFAHLD